MSFFTSLYFSDLSDLDHFFPSSLLLLHRSKISAVTQGFFFWRCLPRISLAVSVTAVLKVIIEDHEGTVSTGCRTITNLRFADDIDGLAGEEEELAKVVECLDKASTAYGMEISAEKTELMTNNTSCINTEIKKAWDSHKLQVPGFSYNWWRFQAWDTLQDSTDNSSIDKVETSLEWQEYFSQLQNTTCHIHLSPVCLWIMDPHSRVPKKNRSHGNEVLPQDTTNILQRPCYQRESPCQDPAGNRTTRRPDHRTEMQTAVVWSCFPFIR